MPACRVLVVTFDVWGSRMGGSAIRAMELARALAAAGHAPTVAAAALDAKPTAEPFPVRRFDVRRPRSSLRPLVHSAEILVLPPHGLVRLPFLHAINLPFVFDLYAPLFFELLETSPERPLHIRRRDARTHIRLMNQVLRRGDFFICASDRQRDLWTGALMANGRLTPRARDMQVENLIDVVPSAVPRDPPPSPQPGRSTLIGAFPAIGPGDTVLVWAGGLWDWLDPITAIEAIAALALESQPVHLVFFAGPHPTVGRSGAEQAWRAKALARERNLLGTRVHFIEEYIPHAERGRYLVECDAGISTHRPHLEARYSYRTRLLDYFWSGLPVICTGGDVIADLVLDRRLGWVVPPLDVSALVEAIRQLRTSPALAAECRSRVAALHPALTWETCVEPLARFCDTARSRRRPVQSGLDDLRALGSSAWRVIVSEGPGEALRRIRSHFLLRR
jgi:glycosyltransferase involved in cell wall biosynthesis